MTLRPPTFAMRLRKPWRRLRTSFEGWYVRFVIYLNYRGVRPFLELSLLRLFDCRVSRCFDASRSRKRGAYRRQTPEKSIAPGLPVPNSFVMPSHGEVRIPVIALTKLLRKLLRTSLAFYRQPDYLPVHEHGKEPYHDHGG